MSKALNIYLPESKIDVYQPMYDEVIRLNGDFEPIPLQITSFFGQPLVLREDGGYLHKRIKVFNLGKDSSSYTLSDSYSNYDYLNYIAIQCWLNVAVERSPATLIHLELLSCLSTIELSEKALVDEITFEKEIAPQLTSIIVGNSDNQRIWASIRIFANFAVEMGFWGFNEKLIFELGEASIHGHGKKFRVSLLDHEYGPFTRSEVSEISQAIHHPVVSVQERVIIKLAMQFGLRPIQLALLRESDIYYDDKLITWFINIPRVKGKTSQLRRTKNNFVTRELPDDLVVEIQQLIKEDSVLEQQDVDGNLLPRPLIKNNKLIYAFLNISSFREYAWHHVSNSVTKLFKQIEQKLDIASRHLVDTDGEPFRLKLNCYRFRYTLGTRMVMEGKTPEEVAVALDHSSTASVAHYFRYNRDLIDFIDDTFESSLAIKNAVSRWQGFLIDQNDQIAGSLVRISDIASLGKCLKQTRCDMHPTVSCYSCTRFRPFIDADHEAQLKVIEIERDFVAQNSSGPVKHQLEEAWMGAIQVVEAQKHLRGKL